MRVSIITTSFNSSKTILNTIQSVNQQCYKEIEHVFIDGGSTDNTLEIIKANSTRTNVIISEKDKGIYNAMNKGLKFANGDVIGFLNSDDRFIDNTIVKRIVNEFKPGIDCIYGNLIFVNSSNDIVRKWKSRSFKSGLFKYSWTPAHPTFYCKKSIYNEFGNYREDLNIGADVDLMFRFLEIHQLKSSFIDQTLVEMRIGGTSTKSFISTIIITKEVLGSFKQHGYNYSTFIYIVSKIYKAYKQLKSFQYFNSK